MTPTAASPPGASMGVRGRQCRSHKTGDRCSRGLPRSWAQSAASRPPSAHSSRNGPRSWHLAMSAGCFSPSSCSRPLAPSSSPAAGGARGSSIPTPCASTPPTALTCSAGRARSRIWSASATRPRFVFLSGNSGAGESALIRAGLVPRLLADARWRPILLDMGDRDFDRGLAAALGEAFWLALSDGERTNLGLAEFPAPTGRSGPCAPAAASRASGRSCSSTRSTITSSGTATASSIPTSTLGGRPPRPSPSAAFGAGSPPRCGASSSACCSSPGATITAPWTACASLRAGELPAAAAARGLRRPHRRQADPPASSTPGRGRPGDRLGGADRAARHGPGKQRPAPAAAAQDFLGLRSLQPLNVRAYERIDGAEGLEALFVGRAVAEAANAAGLDGEQVLAFLLALVDHQPP